MPYEKLRGKSEQKYRDIFDEVYCKAPIATFDGIEVKFFSDRFSHAFFESANRRTGDKSLFSDQRAERITWIKETLEDSTAVLKKGWIKRTKSYSDSSRVAIVKNNYVVIIQIVGVRKAKFITAYVADNSIGKILSSPDWV